MPPLWLFQARGLWFIRCWTVKLIRVIFSCDFRWLWRRADRNCTPPLSTALFQISGKKKEEKKEAFMETLWTDGLLHWDDVGENFWKSSVCAARILPSQPCQRERLTFIYDFRVDEAFENVINISPSPQALQVMVVSPTKAFNKSEKGDGHMCSLLLISECWKAVRWEANMTVRRDFCSIRATVLMPGLSCSQTQTLTMFPSLQQTKNQVRTPNKTKPNWQTTHKA